MGKIINRSLRYSITEVIHCTNEVLGCSSVGGSRSTIANHDLKAVLPSAELTFDGANQRIKVSRFYEIIVHFIVNGLHCALKGRVAC